MTSPPGCGPRECAAWAQVDDLPQAVAGMHSPAGWCLYLDMASDILWGATGRRWRGETLTTEVVLRPEPPRAGEAHGWPWSRSWGCCPCFDGVGPAGLRWRDPVGGRHLEPVAVRLPHPDVVEVLVVEVDGLPYYEWRLDGAWLTNTGCSGWSTCRDRTLVTYRYGHAPPPAGKAAVIELAVELGRAAADSPDRPCRLPQRVQSITRQGISYAVLDDFSFLQDGFTGLYSVDAWIRAVNPYGRAQVGRVWSPDLPRARRVTP